MGYSIPSYVVAGGPTDSVVHFTWDDARPKDVYLRGSDDVIEKLTGVTLRAKFAAAIGVYEWIIARFRQLSDDPIPFQVAEAAWCATIHPAYMRYFELDRRKWIGPVRGPLWCAATFLSSMIFFCSERKEPAAWAAFLSSIARHVLSDRQPFDTWQDLSLSRLVTLYPAVATNPYENLFDDQPELGPLLSREVLDPKVDYRPEMAREAMTRYLQGVNYRHNPFLLSPDEMKVEGFKEMPYVL